ncbi:MAG: ATP synthase subunit I [Candidatus Korobacteraceae bacterium]
MPHFFQLVLLLFAGMLLGIVYFGGLAWTVRRLVAGGGALLTAGSFLVRGALLLAGFWLLAGTHAEYWIACLVGFTAARVFLSKLVVSSKAAPSKAAPWELCIARPEDTHASHH